MGSEVKWFPRLTLSHTPFVAVYDVLVECVFSFFLPNEIFSKLKVAGFVRSLDDCSSISFFGLLRVSAEDHYTFIFFPFFFRCRSIYTVVFRRLSLTF